MGPGESRSRPRNEEAVPDCMSLNASSPEYEFEILCDKVISRAVSMVSIHSWAALEVAVPSDDAAFGSSKLKCLSC